MFTYKGFTIEADTGDFYRAERPWFWVPELGDDLGHYVNGPLSHIIDAIDEHLFLTIFS